MESFISPEEKNKIMNRLFLDCREEQWKFQPLLPSGASSSQMKQPTSAVAYKRPISQCARVAMAMGVPPQVRAEDILFLASDVSPPVVFEVEFSHDQEQDPCALHMERLMRLDSFLERPSTSKVRKSRSWSVPSWSEWAMDLAWKPQLVRWELVDVEEGCGCTQRA